jgi:ABC-type dipeptide/oligopeptide/nickel transport system permease component
MTRYLLGRLVQAVAVVATITIVVFVLLRLSPGDPAAIKGGIEASPEVVKQYAREFGTNRSISEQFWRFVSHAAHGDLGQSIRYNEPVGRVIISAIPYTLALGAAALLLSVTTSLLLGVAAARKPGSLADHASSLLAAAGQATPVFWFGLLLIELFSVRLALLPSGGWAGVQSLIMPAVAVALSMLPTQLRVLRSSMKGALGEDYIRTARAFGLPERRVSYVYALRNATLPVLTVIGVDIGFLLGGVIVAETVFNYPGIGQLAIQALGARDYPLIQVIAIGSALVFVVINLLVDLLYTVVDPRVRISG